jgi:hypothetical protein
MQISVIVWFAWAVGMYCIELYQLVRTVYDIGLSGVWYHFREPWNFFELISLSVNLMLVYSFHAYWEQSKTSEDEIELQQSRKPYDPAFVDLKLLRDAHRNFCLALALMAVITCLRVFKYTRWSATLNRLWIVVFMAMGDLLGFLVILLFLWICFAIG